MLPPLKTNQINVFLFNNPAEIDKKTHDFYFANLSQPEQQKYHRFYFEKDRRLYLVSHAMLRLVLANYLNCSTQSLRFVENNYGKPALKNYPGFRFNLSHSKNAVALIVSHMDQLDLGVDIECSYDRGQVPDVAAHYFSKDESSLLLMEPKEQQIDLFFKLWTLKEAYIKAIGKGLSIDLGGFSFSSLEQGIKVSHYSCEEEKKYWGFYYTKPFDSYHLAIAIRSGLSDFTSPDIKTFEYFSAVSCVEFPLRFITSSQFRK